MNYDQNNGNTYPTNVEYNYNYGNPNGYYVSNQMPLSYHIKRFLIGLLLAFLLIFLLVWIFPTKAGLKSTINDSVSDAFDKTFAEKLEPLYDRIFSDNVNTMKEVATAYYTTERLPKAEGQTKRLTLGKMLDMKLLLSIKDKNGKMCDRDKSYVEVTKMDKEYKMKINLSCGDEEDYIITYLGCYNYCLNDVCEKKTTTETKTKVVTATTTTPIKRVIRRIVTPTKHYCEIYNGKYYGKNGTVVSKTIYQNQCNHKPVKHYCAIYNGKYYGKNGTVVSKTIYKKQCGSTPVKRYCTIYNGKYYGKNGTVVSKDTYKKQCGTTPEKHYCVYYNGKYYGKNGTVVSKSVFKKQCSSPEPEKYYCEIHNGKHYGQNGDVVSEETYKAECLHPEVVYKYLYEKIVSIHHEKQYSEWTDWSSNIEYNPDNNNINWGKHEFEWNEKVGYKLTRYYSYEPDTSQPIYDTYYDRLLGYKKQYACDGYTYYIDTTTNTTYYSSNTPASGWTKTSRVTLSYLPTQSSTKRYVYIGMNYDYCAETCNLKPYYIFDVYTRNPGTATTTMTSTSKSTVSAVCNNVVTKEIPMYGKRTEFAGYVTNKVLRERRTYYYHKKTRTLIQNEYTSTKKYQAWSLSKHDETLINQGYEYTGIYKEISD